MKDDALRHQCCSLARGVAAAALLVSDCFLHNLMLTSALLAHAQLLPYLSLCLLEGLLTWAMRSSLDSPPLNKTSLSSFAYICRASDLGHALVIGLSTTRYRSNAYSHHEVCVIENGKVLT